MHPPPPPPVIDQLPLRRVNHHVKVVRPSGGATGTSYMRYLNLTASFEFSNFMLLTKS